MTRHPTLRASAFLACALALAACSTADTAPAEAPPAPTTSTTQAEARLAAVARERAAIEARFAEREAVCYDKFFVNRCLDEAGERRRVDLLAQRAIEIEAERYLRRNKVEERDRAMAEAEAAYREEEARMAADPAPAKTPAATPPPRARSGESRVARNARAPQAGAEKLSAEERAANVAAYEERRRKSEERQQEVARRVAEREAKAARQAQEEAARKAGTQPAPAATDVD